MNNGHADNGQCRNGHWDNGTLGLWDNRQLDNGAMINETTDIGKWKLGQCEVGPSLIERRVCPFANSSSPPQASSSSLVSSSPSSQSCTSIIHHPPSLSSFARNCAEHQCEYENTLARCGVRSYAELPALKPWMCAWWWQAVHIHENIHRGARTHDHKVKGFALCRLS